MKKKNQCILLVLCMILSLFPVQTYPSAVDAASKPKLSKSSYTFTKISDTKDFSVNNVSPKYIKSFTVSSSNSVVASATTLSKTKLRVYSYYQGKTTITAKVKVKKPKKKSKTYALKLKIYVKPKTATPTPSVTVAPTATPTFSPTASPSVKPSASPSKTPSASPSRTPTSSPSAAPTIRPSTSPTVSPTVSSSPEPTSTTVTISFPTSPAQDESEAYSRIMAMRSYFPDNTHWDNEDVYHWYNVLSYNGTRYRDMAGAGCVGIACILSDAAFGRNEPATWIDHPSASSIRIGDILRVNNDSHSVIVIGTEGDHFTVAEGNVQLYDSYGYFMDSVIRWGREISKNDPIDYVWTRWS